LIVSKRFNKNNRKAIESRLMFEAAKEELYLTSERFETVFKEAPVGIFLYDVDLKILEVNQEFSEILDAPIDYLIGLDMSQLPDKRIFSTLHAVIDKIEGFYEGEYTVNYNHHEIWISMRTSPLFDSEGHVIGGIGIVTDITKRMHDQQKIHHQAYHDALTDVPNRMMLTQRLNQELVRYKRHSIISGLLFLDLDHFKDINDSLGHHIGDELLIEVAYRLKSIIREEDIVSRLGGDEFVILLADLGTKEISAVNKAELIAQKVHAALETPFHIQHHLLTISTSIGIVITDALNTTTEALLKHADTAMYQAKKEGRGISSFYRPEMDRLLKRRLKLHNSLHSAIKHNELQLYYQPIVNFATNKIIGAEALLRWENREIGRISPDEFIPIAEEGGFIIPIGTWVLHEACKHLAQWQSESAEGLDLQKISVNVSSKQFSEPEFVTKVLDAIKQSGINPNHLELELTESIIVDDIDAVIRKMQLLRSHGIGISMDDFGTGYSSLSYLKKLPFSTLKIDKSFTQDIQTDINDAELIRSIITIAKTFHLKVIAEGVETMQQHDFLLQNECCCYQGYFCTPALPSAAFSDFIKKYHASKIF
jgi:diguanylate cyclase (GGDEF)-like protein/PAS domain S-box-containing protein